MKPQRQITDPQREYQMLYGVRIGFVMLENEGSRQFVTPWLGSEDACWESAREHAKLYNGEVAKLSGAGRHKP
jgi:hypothetical protein